MKGNTVAFLLIIVLLTLTFTLLFSGRVVKQDSPPPTTRPATQPTTQRVAVGPIDIEDVLPFQTGDPVIIKSLGVEGEVRDHKGDARAAYTIQGGKITSVKVLELMPNFKYYLNYLDPKTLEHKEGWFEWKDVVEIPGIGPRPKVKYIDIPVKRKN